MRAALTGLLLAAILALGAEDAGPRFRAVVALGAVPLALALGARRPRRVYARNRRG